jgi:hypothetical protein
MRGESERERERMRERVLDEISCGLRKVAIDVMDRKG